MPRKSPSSDSAKEQFWRKTIARQMCSGLSQSAFCKREGLSHNTLSWWKRELASRDGTRAETVRNAETSTQPIFVPLAPVQNTVRVSAVPGPLAEIDLTSRVVRIYAGVDRHSLYEVLAALREVES